jgi:prepilin-type N-terminal cleavage/methylation domain-containing protein
VLRTRRRGFSLIELVVVMAVSLILTGLLLPALSQVRENLNRVISASNQRQLGMVTIMYSRNYNDRLPYTALLDGQTGSTRPWELMSAHLGGTDGGWDGLGLLFSDGYVGNPQLYYCPGYLGEHTYDRYDQLWLEPGSAPIYTNYHYCGDRDWEQPEVRRLGNANHPDQILFSDALFLEGPLNHEDGVNVMREDGSVRWLDNGADSLDAILGTMSSDDPDNYRRIWGRLEELSK